MVYVYMTKNAMTTSAKHKKSKFVVDLLHKYLGQTTALDPFQHQ